MARHTPRAAVALLLASLAHALTDFSCVCEAANRNGCSRSYSCRLNSTIDFYNAMVPDWVTDAEEGLFLSTLDDAVNGLLRPPFFSLGRMTWEAAVACDDEATGELRWQFQLSQCRITTNTNTNTTGATNTTGNSTSTNSTQQQQRRRYHGWASLGFHPLGRQPGTWLTQILGEMADPDGAGDGDPDLARSRCAGTGLYVSVDYVNASRPYDPRFEPAGRWGMLYLQQNDDDDGRGEAGGRSHVYPVGDAGVPSYRTDGDLIQNGVDLNCTGYDADGGGRVCAAGSAGCAAVPNVTHYACPVGRDRAVLGAANCSRRYAAGAGEDESGAAAGMGREAAGGGGLVAAVVVGVAGVLALGLGLGW